MAWASLGGNGVGDALPRLGFGALGMPRRAGIACGTHPDWRLGQVDEENVGEGRRRAKLPPPFGIMKLGQPDEKTGRGEKKGK